MADGDGIAIVQPARGREGHRWRQSKHLTLLGQSTDPELISRVGPDDGKIQHMRQLTGVVDVMRAYARGVWTRGEKSELPLMMTKILMCDLV